MNEKEKTTIIDPMRVTVATAVLQGLLVSGDYKGSPMDFVTARAIRYADNLLNKLALK